MTLEEWIGKPIDLNKPFDWDEFVKNINKLISDAHNPRWCEPVPYIVSKIEYDRMVSELGEKKRFIGA